MTQDEIIELARQAWSDSGESWVAYGWFEDRAKALEAFAKLVEDKATEREREACAKLIESHGSTLANGFMLTEAIRARGEK